MSGRRRKTTIATEGACFVGSHMVDLLLDRDYESSALLFADADYIVHFAGIGDIVPSIECPSEYCEH